MKSTIFSILLACGVISIASMNAESRSERGQKIYVHPEQIALQGNYIIVDLSQGQFRAAKLETDKQGYFVYSNELFSSKDNWCPERNCKYHGSSWEDRNRHYEEVHCRKESSSKRHKK